MALLEWGSHGDHAHSSLIDMVLEDILTCTTPEERAQHIRLMNSVMMGDDAPTTLRDAIGNLSNLLAGTRSAVRARCTSSDSTTSHLVLSLCKKEVGANDSMETLHSACEDAVTEFSETLKQKATAVAGIDISAETVIGIYETVDAELVSKP